MVGEVNVDQVFHYLDLCDLLRIHRSVVVGASFGGSVANCLLAL